MKINISFLVLIIVSVLLAGCKQDFDILSEYEEIPVVYGLLNQNDSVQYIRVQKGYLIEGNAYLAAGITDSIYYPDNLSVQIVAQNGTIYNCERVSIGFNPANPLSKDSGMFANNPNILYKLSQRLDPFQEYTLRVTNGESNKTITASAKLVQDFNIGSPNYGTKITLSNSSPTGITWITAPNGSIYDLTVRFHYIEHNNISNTDRDTFIDVPLLRSYIPSTGSTPGVDQKVDLSADNLFKVLAANIPVNPNVYRDFNIRKGMQIKFAVGGTELAQYISSRQAQGGLTSGEALAPYTNIKPENQAVGIFSARLFKQVDSVLLSNQGLDSLSCSDIMKPLRFRTRSGQFCN